MYGDRLLLLENGSIVVTGSLQEVLTAEQLEKSYGRRMAFEKRERSGMVRVFSEPDKLTK